MLSLYESLKKIYNVNDAVLRRLEISSDDCKDIFNDIDRKIELNQLKVLKSFYDNDISDYHLNGSTGYGYGDSGRDALERVFASIFEGERALVRSQIVSGTHAIAIGLFGNLQDGDELIIATDTPYDTLLKVIGSKEAPAPGTVRAHGVRCLEIPLRENNKIDLEALDKKITSQTKMVYFQRSQGYAWRPSFKISDLKKAISYIKKNHPNVICMVDNCYGEFVEEQEPLSAGADLIAGSLIKNPGGGLALSGGYLVGKTELIENAANRLTAPGIGLEVGASFNFNRSAFQGIFLSPSVVGEALKGAVLAARLFSSLGFEVQPLYQEFRTDIVQAIKLGHPDLMIAFCQGLQKACPLDAKASPEPSFLPGYEHQVIMAGGTYIQGSSIELSADGPIRPPYIIYVQGGMSLSHIKIGLALAADKVILKGF